MLKRTIVYGAKFLDDTKSRTSKDHTGANRGNYGLYDPDKKQAWIVSRDDFFECTVGESAKEIQYNPVDFYDNEAEHIMRRISIESSKQIKLSRRNKMIKSSWKQFIKGLDKLEKRNELKDMYNSAHWEFLNYIMPCDPEWTSDMADGDFNPLDEIYFLFRSPSDIEEFLFECAKENLPGAKEKLRRIRQINTCNKVHSSRQIKSELNHFYNPVTDYIYDNEISEDEWNDVARYQVEENYYLTPQRTKINTYSIYSPQGDYLDQVSDSTKILDVVKKHLSSSRQITSAKSTKKSIQDWIESEMTDEIKEDVYNFFKTSDKYYLDDVITLNQFENIMFKNGFDDQGYMWKESINSSRKSIKSSIITPWDINQVTGTSDEDLGLSAVVDIYGNEFVNVDESTLNELKDTLVRYFDDEAYVRDWNINNPDYQIEDAFEVADPEEMSAEDLARYFDYEAYGRDIRLEDNMVWDSENQYWVSAHDVDDEELNDDKYIFMRG